MLGLYETFITTLQLFLVPNNQQATGKQIALHKRKYIKANECGKLRLHLNSITLKFSIPTGIFCKRTIVLVDKNS